ncbi:MAG TPA: hypothetical protein ENH05_00040 [Rhizobiales bacterium]|nr:hypothetical protein BMS3Bbin10_00363 [bacterium BMS3Bbin10]HDO51110.1 hypothetical protein [Hyphomicrobiales bacterium]
MGYNFSHISKICDLIENGFVSKKLSIFDLGSQDLHYKDRAHVLEPVRSLAKQLGTDSRDAEDRFNEPSGKVPVHKLMADLGVRYVTTDIEPRPDTVITDLNQPTPVPAIKDIVSSFDIVTNFGTTEHIINQMYAFQLIHDLARVGGLIWCHVPLLGMMNHGFVNLTPKFWAAWIAHNKYEVIHSQISYAGMSVAENPNHFYDSLNQIGEYDLSNIINATLNIIVRKRNDNLFVPPMDIPLPALSSADVERIYGGSLQSLYPDAEVEKRTITLRDFLKRRGFGS